jgi:hypothetical protein
MFDSGADCLALVREFFSRPSIQVPITLTPGQNWSSPNNPCLPLTDNFNQWVNVKSSDDHQNIDIGEQGGGIKETVVPNLIGPLFTESLYVFRAERMNAAECKIEGTTELRTDAGNLASVILQLASNPEPQEQFTRYVRTIFPTVFSVVSRPKAENPTVAQIEVINRDANRVDWQPGVRIPLADCGTGISQVLAILYVVLTSENPKVIVIDEPNSFLHPGAAKKLLAILRERRHQYIVTTHSPEIVKSAEPDMLHLTRWTGDESVIDTLNGRDVKDTQRLLKELGARLSDVFGADNVIWVEGPTEEICFPLVLKAFGHALGAGTAVVSIIAPDDLAGKRARHSLAWEIYERLTAGTALIPPALAFSLDRENRSLRDIEDLTRRSKGRAHFLPRRTYENFLLDVAAIRAILNNCGIAATTESVDAWIRENGKQRKYFDDAEVAEAAKADEKIWLKAVDAPELLTDLFWDLSSEAPLAYDKLAHSVALTEWLLEHERDLLKPLADYVAALLRPV